LKEARTRHNSRIQHRACWLWRHRTPTGLHPMPWSTRPTQGVWCSSVVSLCLRPAGGPLCPGGELMATNSEPRGLKAPQLHPTAPAEGLVPGEPSRTPPMASLEVLPEVVSCGRFCPWSLAPSPGSQLQRGHKTLANTPAPMSWQW